MPRNLADAIIRQQQRAMASTQIGAFQRGTLVLGGTSGSGGGSGGPPRGMIGKLIQTNICYDTTEAATSSGSTSILDNLNHIRARIETNEGELDSHFVVTQSSGSLDNEHLHSELYNWHTFHLHIDGPLTVGEKSCCSQIAPGPLTIHGVYPYVQGPSSGSNIIFDIDKNDVTIFTTQENRPTISSGSHTGSMAIPDVTTLVLNDRLDLNVDQIGVPTSGSRASVEVWCKQYLKI